MQLRCTGVDRKRIAAGEHYVGDGAKREDVGGRGGGLAAKLLGCQVVAAGRHVIGARLGRAEVPKRDRVVGGDDHVFRVDVAMSNAGAVQGTKLTPNPSGYHHNLIQTVDVVVA